VVGCRFLDLYAGSGSVGLEAMSRGAEAAVFVEFAASSLAVLRKNLEATGLTTAAEVVASPVGRALARFGRRREAFDLVFADPPYADSAERTEMLRILGLGSVLQPGARMIIEYQARQELELPDGLELVREARYGSTLLAFLQTVRGDNPPPPDVYKSSYPDSGP
jgi:16S rRNA (guanine(966)-N(2))-methyltransferase RsmD